MIKISFLGNSAKENNFLYGALVLGQSLCSSGTWLLFRATCCTFLPLLSRALVRLIIPFVCQVFIFFFLLPRQDVLDHAIYVDIFSHYLLCQLTCAYLPSQNALGNLSAFTELESLLGSTPADSKVHRHDSDVELNLSNYAAIFCSYASSWPFGCVLSWEKGIVGSKNELRLLIGTWKVRLSNISRSSEELISWVDPY